MTHFKNNNEIVRYADLLTRAHEEGLTSIESEVIQIPSDNNGQTAIVRAIAKGERGVFTGIGDADPTNVSEHVVRHLLRVAATRAKARALRDLVGWGHVAVEELGGDDIAAPTGNRWGEPWTEAQRRLLFRLAYGLDYQGEQAADFIEGRLKLVDGETPTKKQASQLIDELQAEVRSRGNGSRHHA